MVVREDELPCACIEVQVRGDGNGAPDESILAVGDQRLQRTPPPRPIDGDSLISSTKKQFRAEPGCERRCALDHWCCANTSGATTRAWPTAVTWRATTCLARRVVYVSDIKEPWNKRCSPSSSQSRSFAGTVLRASHHRVAGIGGVPDSPLQAHGSIHSVR